MFLAFVFVSSWWTSTTKATFRFILLKFLLFSCAFFCILKKPNNCINCFLIRQMDHFSIFFDHLALVHIHKRYVSSALSDIEQLKSKLGQYELEICGNFGQLEAINKQFLTDLMTYHKLYKNKKQYDALIMIISGHGKAGDVLVTSERYIISIDEIRTSSDCNQMKSFQDFPKIFIIDIFVVAIIPPPQTASNCWKERRKRIRKK
ncbi:hypothetical protein RFI_35931 [Reticulomyxa filosa]|uniref:Caspase family p20 domain-containing protein n=1 Tax=Reticulomyxa filosa TaxID=46433 RepID=X6LJH8_RETFI|nr:hypothetical protein RFI_35931 [Reticulomyxa filosa]|eukprot:ETO01511.1 hypothetical protein RFI_35931 [Reticulomyxa filosa]